MKYYYVKLKDGNVGSLGLAGLFNGWLDYDRLDELNWFSREELVELFDGDLYREYPYLPLTWVYRTDGLDKMLGLKYDKDLDIYVWINPLIELVEKED